MSLKYHTFALTEVNHNLKQNQKSSWSRLVRSLENINSDEIVTNVLSVTGPRAACQ